MFKAFLFDFKREISLIKPVVDRFEARKYTRRTETTSSNIKLSKDVSEQQGGVKIKVFTVFRFTAPIMSIIIGAYYYCNALITADTFKVFVSLFVLALGLMLAIFPTYTGKQKQLKWFKEKRVDLVRQMIAPEKTGLSKIKCIDLLILECENHLNQARKSSLIMEKLAPLAVPGKLLITCLSLILFAPQGVSVENSDIESIGDLLSCIIVDFFTQPDVYAEYIVVVVASIIAWMSAILLFSFIIVPWLDSDWAAAQELRGILLYLKEMEVRDNNMQDDSSTSISDEEEE